MSSPHAAKKRLALHWRIVIALVLGTVVGILINVLWTTNTWNALGVDDPRAFVLGAAPTAAPADASQPEPNQDAGFLAHAARFAGRATKFVGDLFLQGLRFVAIPIVLFSLVVGVASLGDPRKLGRLGARTLTLFFTTSIVACLIGLTLSVLVKPGAHVSQAERERIVEVFRTDAGDRITMAESTVKSLSVWDQVVNVVARNPFEALARGDMLQVVVAAVIIGLGLTLIPRESADPVVRVFNGLAEAFLQLVRMLMEAAPFAVFALIAPIIANLGLSVLVALAWYGAVVVAALAIILFGVYPLVLRITVPRDRRIPMRKLIRAMSPAQLLGFSSSSSAATLPVTIECCRDRLGVPDDIASFVCPLGATINMDGTAAYQCIAVTFLAQVFGVDLSFADLATIAGLAVLVSIGSPGLPSASIVLMVVVLDAVNVPKEGIALVLALDRVLDMCRTVVNVSGDATAAVAVAGMENRVIQPPAVVP
jgi:Na+/H+-dicarboxylate symporter